MQVRVFDIEEDRTLLIGTLAQDVKSSQVHNRLRTGKAVIQLIPGGKSAPLALKQAPKEANPSSPPTQQDPPASEADVLNDNPPAEGDAPVAPAPAKTKAKSASKGERKPRAKKSAK